MSWNDPTTHPTEHGAPALLALRVLPDNSEAGLDEHYRIAWWCTRRDCWQMIDAEDWFTGDKCTAGAPMLLGWQLLVHPQFQKSPVCASCGDGIDSDWRGATGDPPFCLDCYAESARADAMEDSEE
ncbi:MAG: hypothetical protein ACI9K2_006627 [Myxococcota bacterium]|jgi:hypothetical protein